MSLMRYGRSFLEPILSHGLSSYIISVNDDGSRVQSFEEEWQAELGDKIKAEANGQQYVAIRTHSKLDKIKGGFCTSHTTLEKWAEKEVWREGKNKETKMFARFESIPLIVIEAQRDIHQDLKNKFSWASKVLAMIEYDANEVQELELIIEKLNLKAVSTSKELNNLKEGLQLLSQTFNSEGNAEITPFPKKMRDLAKYFTAHFGENNTNIFPMEYHGMGTRSWASMLTVNTFVDLLQKKHQDDSRPFFPILAVEEPEAHLHPNAQKTVYSQLSKLKGQVIVSTHSPYLAAIAKQSELRYLKRTSTGIATYYLRSELSSESRRRLQREVIHSRGEILFSKALVLCEGETEEQALPLLFQKYFKIESFAMGINFIGVNGSGKRYLPFLTFAHDFDIPVFIFSDGEITTIKQLKKAYEEIYGETEIENCSNIVILENKNFEEYLISSTFKSMIESVVEEINEDKDFIKKWISKRNGTSLGREKTDEKCSSCNQHIFIDRVRGDQVKDSYDQALKEILEQCKTKYAPAIAEKLGEFDTDKFPEKIIELFLKIKSSLKI
jgi:putative ATP-dependent endonuclease of the OLD family